MTDSNNSNDNWWLPEAFSAAVQGLRLRPSIRQKMSYEQVLAHTDEARLLRLVEPLPLPRPSEVTVQLEKAGAPEIFLSQTVQEAMASWGIMHQAAQILRELSRAVSVLLRAYRRDKLTNHQAILRALPVLAMNAFVPGCEVLRRDLAAILGAFSEDALGLIKSYQMAALSEDDSKVMAIDNRILADSTWSAWVQIFLKEGSDIIRLCRPVTCWEFPESQIAGDNGCSVCCWLFRRG